MHVIDPYAVAIAFMAGLALGAFFSLNLWRSARKLTDAQGTVWSLAGSFILRMAVVLPGLYLVTAGRWERLAAAMAGFILMREILVWRLGRWPGKA